MKRFFAILITILGILALLIFGINRAELKSTDDEVGIADDRNLQQTEITETKPQTIPDEAVEASEEISLEQFVDKLNIAINMPISVHGQVLDLDGAPIPNAEINYILKNKIDRSGSGFSPLGSTRMKPIKTDEDGRFHIIGKGASAYVQAYKDGYYQTDDSAETIPATKSYVKNSPLQLYLRSMGSTDKLERLSEKAYLTKGANRVVAQLDSRRITFHIELSSDYDNRLNHPRKRFDWSAKIEIEGGLLVQRNPKGQFDYTAPVEGYSPFYELSYESEDPNWKARLKEEFYIRFEDGTFARAEIQVSPQRSNPFIVVEGYHNPHENRNLEYDPSLEVTSQ